MENELGRIALLIDADNVLPKVNLDFFVKAYKVVLACCC